MHARNIYRTPPDFAQLLEQFPEIRPHMVTDLSGKVRFNFRDAAALRMLTTTLLRRDFNLNVHIPESHLVPTLPGRLNYVLWVEDLIASLKLSPSDTVVGLDIGTGPCAVYSLLCARRGWSMLATESCEASLAVARDNVTANNLQQQIKVLQSVGDSLLSPLEEHSPVHFCMCNPPFFDSASAEETSSHGNGGSHGNVAGEGSRMGRRGKVLAASTGLASEVSCVGGERQFVGRLIHESGSHRQRCRVFTTLLGHKSSVRPMRRLMHEVGAVYIASTEFCQGNTKRWGLAWTFDPSSRIDTVTPTRQSKKKRAPLQCEVPRHLSDVKYYVPAVKQLVINWLRSDLQMSVDEGHCNKFYASYKLTANSNTWTHSRRLRRLKHQQSTGVPHTSEDASREITDTSVALDARVEECGETQDSSMECESLPTLAVCDREDRVQEGEEEGDDGSCGNRVTECFGKRQWVACERGDDDDPANSSSKRICLEDSWAVCADLGLQDEDRSSADSGVSESCERECMGGSRPLLVFTLFVQAVSGTIYLRLSWLAGSLGWDGVNGVLCWLRHRLRQRVNINASLDANRDLEQPSAV